MQLNPEGGMFKREEYRVVSAFVNVTVMNDVLHDFDQHAHGSLGFLSGSAQLAERSFRQLNQMRNHVSVHGACEGQHNTKG